ncbi:MAG: NAD(P)-dependent glycerol-3-phosphate dehydrogenase [Rhodocyclales bacterium]|nr:NAD(P)-dependent glycerol-3-phosphate dehydrogenase [Rhodocyclales bacterium]
MGAVMQLAVLGAGAWGTALAIAMARRHRVRLWCRDPAQAERIARERCNRRYLPEVALPEEVTVTADFPEALAGVDLALIVTPLSGLGSTVAALAHERPKLPFLWACKGIDPERLALPHRIVAESWPETLPPPHAGVLTGPSFALEVARNLPTALVLAAADGHWAKHWVERLHQPRLRLYAHDDVVGAEVGGALKNVIAIAAGVADGLGFGLNARAALVTRGLAEIARLARALGGRDETLMGLAGMGDLILTTTGALSRNRRVGLMRATGKPLPEILTELGHVAEGVPTTRAAVALARRHGIEMPIAEAVHRLLFEPELAAEAVVEALLARDPKFERL